MSRLPRRDLLGWLFFSGLHLLNAIFHHQWADELQAWSLVRESPNLTELHRSLAFEGHPALWYVTLWPFKFFTDNPAAQQVVGGVFAVAVLALLWAWSPFHFSEKVLLSLSFQLGYNLSVVSRSYVLGTFLLFLFVALIPRYRERPWLGWALLAFLCNVHILYAPLSFCLAVLWLDSTESRRTCLNGLSFYFLGILWCASTILFNWGFLLKLDSRLFLLVPPIVITVSLLLVILGKLTPRAVIAVGWAALLLLAPVFDSFRPGKAKIIPALSNLGRGVLPIVNPLQPDYWHLGMPQSVGMTLAVISGIAVCLYLRPQPFLLAIIGLPTGVLLLISSYLHPGRLWHSGVIFSGFVAVVWFARRARLTLGPWWLLLILLVPQALVGTNAMIRSKLIPISSCHATATWIGKQKLPPERLMGFPIFPTAGVASYLQEPIFFPEMKRRTAAFDWASGATPAQAAERMANRMRDMNYERAFLILPEGDEAIRSLLAAQGVGTSELFLSPDSLRGRYQVWELQLKVTSPP